MSSASSAESTSAEELVLPAAYRLLGTVLPEGWTVVRPMNWRIDKLTGLLARDQYGTGGHFSVGYELEKGPSRAFLKAINLAHIERQPDILAAMKEVTDSVQFEREIHLR